MKEIKIECKDCEGTGLYKGFAEKGSCARICYTCKGTGSVKFIYNEFNGRKIRNDIKRVFGNTHGFVHTDKDYVNENGDIIYFSKGGCAYEEWLKGVKPKPVKELYCPYVWCNDGSGNVPLSECKTYIKNYERIPNCLMYKDKSSCWKKYMKIKEK